jgi:hypothetical protein
MPRIAGHFYAQLFISIVWGAICRFFLTKERAFVAWHWHLFDLAHDFTMNSTEVQIPPANVASTLGISKINPTV